MRELFLGGLFQCPQSLCRPNLVPFSEQTVHTCMLSSFHLPKHKPFFAFWFVRALWPNGIGDCTASDISYLKKNVWLSQQPVHIPRRAYRRRSRCPGMPGLPRHHRRAALTENSRHLGGCPALPLRPPTSTSVLPSVHSALHPSCPGRLRGRKRECEEGVLPVCRSMPVSLGGHRRPWSMLLKSTDLHGEGHRWAPQDQMHKRFEQLCCSSWLTPTRNGQRPPLGFYGRVYNHRRQGHEWWPAQHPKDTMPCFWGDAYTGTRSSWSMQHLAFIKSTLRTQDRQDAFHSITIRSKEEERLSCTGNSAQARRIREMRVRWGGWLKYDIYEEDRY